MWAQTVFVCLLIAVVSFGGSAATSFYQILTDMGNVAATAPELYLRFCNQFWSIDMQLLFGQALVQFSLV